MKEVAVVNTTEINTRTNICIAPITLLFITFPQSSAVQYPGHSIGGHFLPT